MEVMAAIDKQFHAFSQFLHKKKTATAHDGLSKKEVIKNVENVWKFTYREAHLHCSMIAFDLQRKRHRLLKP